MRSAATSSHAIVAARARLAPTQIGRNGDLQEWLDDWGQREKSHRHISNLYGLYPGHQISTRRTPAFAEASRKVLEQRGLTGNGWSSAWKAAAWARLGDAAKAMENIAYAVKNYTTESLFSICSKNLQVDGAFGMTAAVAELLLQSDDGVLTLLPALPDSWKTGQVSGLRARGGFEVSVRWKGGQVERSEILSTMGGRCRVRSVEALDVTSNGARLQVTRSEPRTVEFETTPGATYMLVPSR
jgi:alpha-L-fucosidase 2